MGATSSTANPSARLPVGVNNLVGELGNDIHYEKGMGSSRFLKAIKARHRHGPLVVKTFVKPAAYYSLRILVRRLRVEREALADVPNALTYQKVVETETAGYLIRQWMSTNLYDRISTRPFLTTIEKKWITFQLLKAMSDARQRNVAHGDLKSENVLVTSSLFVYVTDFAASFKQVYLPLNDPSDFNFYFGTSGRRTCYIAPERFYEANSDIAKQKAKARTEASSVVHESSGMGTQPVDAGTEKLAELFKRDGKITEAMDVFSLGCVIAELWRDGAPFFTLMQLFKYREGELDVRPALAEIPDLHVRAMVKSMTSSDPKKRKSFSTYLAEARTICFPDVFYSFLHRYLTTLQRNSLNAGAATEGDSTSAKAPVTSTRTHPASNTPSVAPSDSHHSVTNEAANLFRAEADERVERLFEEWPVVSRVLDGEDCAFERPSEISGTRTPLSPSAEQEAGRAGVPSDEQGESIVPPDELCIPGIDRNALKHARLSIVDDGPALLILMPILSNMRNVLRPSSKLHCFELLLHLSARWLSDEAKLDRVLPYVINMIDDESVMVRIGAIRSTVTLLALVDTITPSNSSTFSEYVMPILRSVTRDPSSLVRATYAARLKDLSTIGTRYLQMTSAMRAEGVFTADADGRAGGAAADFLEGGQNQDDEFNYDRQIDTLCSLFQEEAVTLLSDSSPIVKRSILITIGPLCRFFGSSLTNDVILSHMITFLNDRSWLLRQAFFDAIPVVAQVAGAQSVEDYILTLLIQALSDPEEFVVVHVLYCLARMMLESSKGRPLISQGKTLEIATATSGFLCHPNEWLRTATCMVLAICAKHLGAVETWALLYPSVRPLLRCDVEDISPNRLVFAAKEPLSREILSKAVQWALRAKVSHFWKPQREDMRGKAGLANGLGKEGVGLFANLTGKGAVKTPVQRNEEDDAYFDGLRSSGLSESDERKLVSLRDYILKLARASNLIGPADPSNAINQEDASILPPLPIRSALTVQALSNVTPLTIFFGTQQKTVSDTAAKQHEAGSAMRSASIRTQTVDDSFSSRVAKRRMGNTRIVSDSSSLNPLEELRLRMIESSLSHGSVASEQAMAIDSPLHHDTETGSDAGSEAVANSAGPQGRLAIGKAQPAIASTSATVSGTMADRKVAKKENTTSAGTGIRPPSKNLPEAKDMEPTFASTYEGDDPYIRAHLEAIWISTFQDRIPGWGPTVNDGISRRRNMRGAQRLGGAPGPAGTVSSNRRPEGNLVAYFTEHTAPVVAIAVSPDHAFFVSGSGDGTIKVWDTARLEKNVTSRSRGTYTGQKGEITSLVMLDASYCVASSATDGSVHVIRVDVSSPSVASSSLPRYGKIRLVSNFQLSNPEEYVVAMMQSSRRSDVSNRDSPFASRGASSMSFQSINGSTTPSSTGSTLLLATSKNRIIILDLRTMQVLSTFQNAAHAGSISAICTDNKGIWLLIGTMRGCLCLWDLRFQLLVKTWQVAGRNAYQVGRGQSFRINSIVLHPSKGAGKWVLVAYENLNLGFQSNLDNFMDENESTVETWDIERGVCVEMYSSMRGTPNGKDGKATKHAFRQERFDIRANFNGLSSPADAIQELIHAHESHKGTEQSDDNGEDKDTARQAANAQMDAKHRQIQGRDVIPAAPASAAARAIVVNLEGYASSNIPHAAQVSGGWLDAGRLAASDIVRDEASSQSAGGPAGYMLTGGLDRRIRFWDLGRAEKSTAFGSMFDERNEFRTSSIGEEGNAARGEGNGESTSDGARTQQQVSDAGSARPATAASQAMIYTHHILPTASTARAASSALRSPLLTQHASSVGTNVLMRAHKNAITALAVIESPFRCVVAGDVSGNIRVWE